MKHSHNAIDVIKKSRKLLTVASSLWNDRLYIGYSHLIHVSDGLSDIKKISKKEATILLEKDLLKISKQVTKALDIKLTQNQFDAVVCLVYDIGIKSFISSGMRDMLNRGEFIEASLKFRQWSRYKKTPIYQLIKSRRMEMALFDTPID